MSACINNSRVIIENPNCKLRDDSFHRPFVATNEAKHKEIIDIFKKVKQLPGDTLVGVSCFATLNLAAARPMDDISIIIVDRGLRVQDFWKNVIPLIASCKNRKEFREALFQLYADKKDEWGKDLPPEINYFENYNLLEEEIFPAKISWISSDQSFKRIQKIVNENNLMFFPADLCDPIDVENLSKYLASTNRNIGVLYISNCQEYASTEDGSFHTLVSSVDRLASKSKPLLITTHPRWDSGTGPNCSKKAPVQHLFQYESQEQLSKFWNPKEGNCFSYNGRIVCCQQRG